MRKRLASAPKTKASPRPATMVAIRGVSCGMRVSGFGDFETYSGDFFRQPPPGEIKIASERSIFLGGPEPTPRLLPHPFSMPPAATPRSAAAVVGTSSWNRARTGLGGCCRIFFFRPAAAQKSDCRSVQRCASGFLLAMHRRPVELRTFRRPFSVPHARQNVPRSSTPFPSSCGSRARSSPLSAAARKRLAKARLLAQSSARPPDRRRCARAGACGLDRRKRCRAHRSAL